MSANSVNVLWMVGSAAAFIWMMRSGGCGGHRHQHAPHGQRHLANAEPKSAGEPKATGTNSK